jgi:hypothetical protein
MLSVATDRFPAFAPGYARFFGGKFVGATLLVSSFPAFTRDFALPLRVHHRETTAPGLLRIRVLFGSHCCSSSFSRFQRALSRTGSCDRPGDWDSRRGVGDAVRLLE